MSDLVVYTMPQDILHDQKLAHKKFIYMLPLNYWKICI